MLFLAMSCLQGRTQENAFENLTRLEPDGLQLTPGNLPSPGFQQRVATWGRPTSLHHGFVWDKYKTEVYAGDEPVVDLAKRSVHPPKRVLNFKGWLETMVRLDAVVEVMYPDYVLGCGAEVEAAMEAGLRLAVDISHVYIQVYKGVIEKTTLDRLWAYDKIAEVHVSESDGRADQHRPLSPSAPFLGWALDQQRAGTLTVLESYFHRLSEDERRRQVEQARV